MALTEDQRALLGLLLAGETYESVSGVLGTTPAEVRSRTHRAAEALEAEAAEGISSDEVRDRIEVLEGVRPAPAAAPPATRDFRRYGLWAAVIIAAATIVVVIFAVGGGGGNDTQTITASNSPQEDVVPIRLTPVGGARAGGTIA